MTLPHIPETPENGETPKPTWPDGSLMMDATARHLERGGFLPHIPESEKRQKEPTFTELLDAKMEECHPNDPKRCLNPLHRHHDPMWPGFHGNIRDYDWKTQDDGTILGTPKS
jgi:hypothetical protein